MIFIQTLYIDVGKDPFRDTFGWVAPEYHLMGWALSCLQLHKLYGNITLYANSRAAHLLIDTLQLPYSNVHLAHDELTLIHPELWALPKIYTYSLQEQPFLHIDGDVFLFSPFNLDLLEGELIAQNVEVATEKYYRVTQKALMQHFTFFPPCVKKDFESGIPVQCCNAGILGGHNLTFFRDYAASVFEYIYQNVDSLKYINVGNFNVFFEQHLFYALAKEKGISVSVLFERVIEDNGYKYIGDFQDVPFRRNYLHLLGHFKRDEFTCIQMAAKLRELYPEYYERIVTLFQNKNLRLSPCGFRNSINASTRLVDEQANTHLQRLKYAATQCPPYIDQELFQRDFETFYQRLVSFVSIRAIRGFEELQKRDLEAQHWYRNLFANSTAVAYQSIVNCSEWDVYESAFNWTGLFNKSYRVGTSYYADLQIEKGQFFNLVVAEATDNGFSLYDINEIDYALLQLLSEPLSISEVLAKMEMYFEDDVLQHHFQTYEELILSSIKQLVIYKTIKPL